MAEGAQAASGDQLQQGTIPGVDPAVTTPAAEPAPAPAADAAVTATGSGTDGVSGGAAADPILEAFGKRDPDLAKRFASGQALTEYLHDEARRQAARAQELQAFAPIAQQVAPYLGEFQAWRKQQEESRRAEAEKQKKWWSAPEYSPGLRDAVYQDPTTGEYKEKPGHAGAMQKLATFIEHQRSFLDNFAADPIKAIRPGIEEVVREVAGAMVKEQMGGHEQATQANEFVQKNAEWIFQPDGQGGRRLSDWGQRLAHYVSEAEQLGIRDVAQIQRYAMSLVQRDYAVARMGQPAQPAAPTVSPNDQHKQQFLAGAAQPPARQTPPSRGGASPEGGVNRVSGGDHRSRLQQMALEEARRQGLQVNGV